MKKVLFSAIVASLAFAGCTNDESLVPPQEIDFQVAKYLSSSRATGSEFTGTFGTYSSGLGNGKEMANTEIALNDGVWKATSGTYHWPATGTVSFISYAPYATTCPFTIDAAAGSVSVTSYVNDGSKDLMLADYATELNGNVDYVTTTPSDGGYEGVPTLFRHMLSNISFKIGLTEAAQTAGYSVQITDMELTGIHNTGSISLSTTTGDATYNMKEWEWPDNGYWTSTSGDETIPITAPSGFITDLTEATLTNCYLLPQEFTTDGQQISFSYQLKYNGVEGDVIPVTRDLEGITTGHAGWGINKKILYKISIGVATNEITFDPAVVEWSSEPDVNVTI